MVPLVASRLCCCAEWVGRWSCRCDTPRRWLDDQRNFVVNGTYASRAQPSAVVRRGFGADFADASHLSFELYCAYVLSVEEARQRQWFRTGIVEPGLGGCRRPDAFLA